MNVDVGCYKTRLLQLEDLQVQTIFSYKVHYLSNTETLAEHCMASGLNFEAHFMDASREGTAITSVLSIDIYFKSW